MVFQKENRQYGTKISYNILRPWSTISEGTGKIRVLHGEGEGGVRGEFCENVRKNFCIFSSTFDPFIFPTIQSCLWCLLKMSISLFPTGMEAADSAEPAISWLGTPPDITSLRLLLSATFLSSFPLSPPGMQRPYFFHMLRWCSIVGAFLGVSRLFFRTCRHLNKINQIALFLVEMESPQVVLESWEPLLASGQTYEG